MTQIALRPPGGRAFRPRRVERFGRRGELSTGQVVAAAVGQNRAVTGQPGRQHTVEHVDTPGDRFDDADGVAQTHEISGLIEREEIHARIEAEEHLAAILPHTQAANGVAVEADLGHLASGLFAQRFVSTACTMPNWHWRRAASGWSRKAADLVPPTGRCVRPHCAQR